MTTTIALVILHLAIAYCIAYGVAFAAVLVIEAVQRIVRDES